MYQPAHAWHSQPRLPHSLSTWPQTLNLLASTSNENACEGGSGCSMSLFAALDAVKASCMHGCPVSCSAVPCIRQRHTRFSVPSVTAEAEATAGDEPHGTIQLLGPELGSGQHRDEIDQLLPLGALQGDAQPQQVGFPDCLICHSGGFARRCSRCG